MNSNRNLERINAKLVELNELISSGGISSELLDKICEIGEKLNAHSDNFSKSREIEQDTVEIKKLADQENVKSQVRSKIHELKTLAYEFCEVTQEEMWKLGGLHGENKGKS